MNTITISGKEFNDKYSSHTFYRVGIADHFQKESDIKLPYQNETSYLNKLTFVEDDALVDISALSHLRIRGFFLYEKTYIYSDNYLTKLVLKNQGSFLRHVPKENQTLELCLIAVSSDGSSLQFVDPNIQTEELCEAAVLSNVSSIKFFNEKFLTQKILGTAITKDWRAIMYIKPQYQTEELCNLAVMTKSEAFRYIDYRFQTEALLNLAKNYEYIFNISCDKNINDDIYIIKFEPIRAIYAFTKLLIIKKDMFKSDIATFESLYQIFNNKGYIENTKKKEYDFMYHLMFNTDHTKCILALEIIRNNNLPHIIEKIELNLD